MKKDNLKIVDGKETEFRDIKYGFYYIHDVKSDLENEYEIIYKKYFRRIDYFREAITHPTVFFRCVRDIEEVVFINKNYKYAENLLKRYNEKNQIVYMLSSILGQLTNNVHAYYLNISEYIGETYEMRHLFDNSEKLLNLCANIIDNKQKQRNIEFDILTNAQRIVALYVNKCVEKNIDGIDDIILNALDASRNEGIFLWGRGKYGMPLAKYLRERKVLINGIIDNDYSEKMKDGFKIIPFERVNDGVKIFIAVTKKEDNEAIVKQIMSQHRKSKIIKYQDLYNGFEDIL